MSAYIVDKKHILYLVKAAMSRRLNPYHGPFRWIWGIDRQESQYSSDMLACNDYAKAAEVANMLWQENIKSVSYRYPGDSTENLPGPVGVKFEITEQDFCDGQTFYETYDPVQVLKSVACYEYQACEHDEWEDSQAHSFCRALEKSAINALPGYDAAEWGSPKTKAEIYAEAKVNQVSLTA